MYMAVHVRVNMHVLHYEWYIILGVLRAVLLSDISCTGFLTPTMYMCACVHDNKMCVTPEKKYATLCNMYMYCTCIYMYCTCIYMYMYMYMYSSSTACLGLSPDCHMTHTTLICSTSACVYVQIHVYMYIHVYTM